MFYRGKKMGEAFVIVAVLLVTMFICAVGFNYIYAQEGGAKAGPKESGIMDLIKAGSWVGHFIILCSIVGMGFIIEHIVNIKRDKLCPPDIVAELEALVEEGRYEEAVTLCSSNPNFFCNIVGAALSKVNEGYDAMVEAMSTSGEEESAKLNMKISYISLIGNIAPMLGLTGTVTGMIASFGEIKINPAPSPADLAEGVEQALVTTAEGLFVSMPLMTAFFLFKNKVTLYIIEIGIMAGEFVDKFKNMSVEQQQ
ncbi:MAG: MotA/TolQ/ExbB proton channel family protein [Planctomycetota bacterium]